MLSSASGSKPYARITWALHHRYPPGASVDQRAGGLMLVIGNAGRLADDRDLHLSAVPLPLAATGPCSRERESALGSCAPRRLARALVGQGHRTHKVTGRGCISARFSGRSPTRRMLRNSGAFGSSCVSGGASRITSRTSGSRTPRRAPGPRSTLAVEGDGANPGFPAQRRRPQSRSSSGAPEDTRRG